MAIWPHSLRRQYWKYLWVSTGLSKLDLSTRDPFDPYCMCLSSVFTGYEAIFELVAKRDILLIVRGLKAVDLTKRSSTAKKTSPGEQSILEWLGLPTFAALEEEP